MRKSVVGFAVCFTLQWAFCQDFHKIYDLPAGGQILIGNVLGDVRVTGYDGKSVEIKAFKRGPDKDLIQINDLSFGNRIELLAQYPPHQNQTSSVDFEVRVPTAVEYNFSRISSFGGNVEVTGVTGRLRAESIRGNVELKDVRGLVSASSVSGDVNVEIVRGQERSHMRFSSISGNIDVWAPAKLDAVVEMSSTMGALRTDFPIDIQERRYGPGRSARGRLGEGKQSLRISSVSGRVSLIQK
jgi:hypothetical protein